MSLTSLLLNGAMYAAGWLTCRLLFHDKSRGHPVAESRKQHSRSGWTAVVVGIVLVLFGAQQVQYQTGRDDDADRLANTAACISTWGVAMSDWASDVVDTITTRTDATAKLDAAKARRDNAVDQVVAVVILARTVPPRADEADFDAALRKFAQAKANLRHVQTVTKQTRQANPYPAAPVLNCSSGKG